MKMSIFGMLFILVVMAVAPLVYFNGGKEYMRDMFFSTGSVESKLNKDVVYAPVSTDKKVKVFKWKDENGIWQFGGNPPAGLAGVESMTLQPNVNIMKPIDVPEELAESDDGGRSGLLSLRKALDKGKDKSGKKDKDGVGISQDSLNNPYSPDSISELFKSSQNIEKVLHNRQQSQLNNQPK